MSKAILDADEILRHATPVAHQTAHEIQPYGHLVRMPIALAESACKDSVENLNHRFRGCSTHTRSSSRRLGQWRACRPSATTRARTTCS
jgi:hypothetical protein